MNVCFGGKYILERGLLMEQIISNIYKILKETDHLIEFEEKLHLLMYELFTSLVGDVFTHVNKIIKEQKQAEGWKVERSDDKGVYFTFGEVRFNRRSEEHTSELQSRGHIVCRLLLEKQNTH